MSRIQRSADPELRAAIPKAADWPPGACSPDDQTARG